jgi:hypothetical protein
MSQREALAERDRQPSVPVNGRPALGRARPSKVELGRLQPSFESETRVLAVAVRAATSPDLGSGTRLVLDAAIDAPCSHEPPSEDPSVPLYLVVDRAAHGASAPAAQPIAQPIAQPVWRVSAPASGRSRGDRVAFERPQHPKARKGAALGRHLPWLVFVGGIVAGIVGRTALVLPAHPNASSGVDRAVEALREHLPPSLRPLQHARSHAK